MNPVIMGHPLHHHGSTEIVIRQIANGWMVILPHIHQLPEQPDVEELMRKQFRIAKEEFGGGDDVLDKIRKENQEQPQPKKAELRPAPKIIDLKDENVYCFKTFPELLEFLAEKIK